jgi:hypothetical protein
LQPGIELFGLLNTPGKETNGSAARAGWAKPVQIDTFASHFASLCSHTLRKHPPLFSPLLHSDDVETNLGCSESNIRR